MEAIFTDLETAKTDLAALIGGVGCPIERLRNPAYTGLTDPIEVAAAEAASYKLIRLMRDFQRTLGAVVKDMNQVRILAGLAPIDDISFVTCWLTGATTSLADLDTCFGDLTGFLDGATGHIADVIAAVAEKFYVRYREAIDKAYRIKTIIDLWIARLT